MGAILPTIAVLGASGLIGQAVASRLREEGFPVVPIARRFTAAQKAAFGQAAVERPIVALDSGKLARFLDERKVDIVVNCIGVLQDSTRGRTGTVHCDFVDRLVDALGREAETVLLVHLSIPGRNDEDRTLFSRTKRDAERAIAAGLVPFVILQPGFVVASAAYGGSALIRALAVLPFELPVREAAAPFAATDVGDIARTVAFVARRWQEGERRWSAIWSVMQRQRSTVGAVLDAFRRHFGGPTTRLPLPTWLLDVSAKAGDLVVHLGWAPPIRSTALQEMRRGVEGDPGPWIAATGIEPAALSDALHAVPFTVQEKWFARLYLTKALVIASLVVFWCVSGLIALTAAFEPATAILTSRGFAPQLAVVTTVVSSLLDVSVGFAIAFRRTCRAGLLTGIAVSLFYMVGAAMITPDLWIEPLGALVKTGPAIVLMLVALAILEER